MKSKIIEAVLIFGSRARGDGDASSDLDIIVVTQGRSQKTVERGGLNVSCYSPQFLIKLCREGNLFALHLVTEAVPFYDPTNILEGMKRNFLKKISYAKEKSDASMLGWFLLRHINKIQDWPLFNKRVAWCVRTLLIATAYEEGSAIFSASSLFDYFHDDDANWLIDRKGSSVFVRETPHRFASVINKFGLTDPYIYDVGNINLHIEHIFRSKNIVGQNTIISLFSKSHLDYLS